MDPYPDFAPMDVVERRLDVLRERDVPRARIAQPCSCDRPNISVDEDDLPRCLKCGRWSR